MPKKNVVQYDCERCRRDWYEDAEVPVGKLILELREPDGNIIRGSYDILCKSCTKTVTNLVKSLLRDMKKNSPDKSKAKEGATTPSEPPVGPSPPALTALDTAPEQTPRGVAIRLPPSALSKSR